MSGLRSAVDQAIAEDDRSIGSSELAQQIVEVVDAQDRLDALAAAKVVRLNSQGLAELGYPSVTSFLTDACRLSPSHAKRIASAAEASRNARATYDAWIDGRLSGDQARALFEISNAVPSEFAAAEERLVEIVEPLSVTGTKKTLEYWRQSVDGPGELDPEVQQLRRGVSVSRSIGGMTRVDGWLTTNAGEGFLTALDAHMPPPSEDDHRTPRQRRHDALEEMVRCHLGHGDTPIVGGEKPHAILLVDIDALQGIAGGTHETTSGQILDVETIRMVACDSSVSRIVLGPDSEILDVGRKTRVWTAAQRRAIVARDRHCTAPGCERPPHWCDIHYEDHWADGGTTSVEKGRLFCRFHHTVEHIKLSKRRRRRIEG